MKANELMIGDWVRVNHDGLCIRKDSIVEVRGIDADDKLTEKGLVGSAHCRPLDDDQFEGGIWCEHFVPIPLTSEILEKNGFVRLSDTVYYIQNVSLIVEIRLWEQIKIRIGEKYNSALRVGYDWFINGLTITNVHELQHILRLCGIEKEIEL